MRKPIFTIGILCALVLLLTGCKTKIDTQALNAVTSLSQITPTEIQVRKMSSTDSVNLNGIAGSFKIIADFPETGNFFVINNIREWISEQLGGTYEGNLENATQMFDHYQKAMLQDFQQNIIPDLPNIDGISCYREYNFEKTDETDRYVTYQYTLDVFSGGAHGGHISQGQTFRKSDGRRIDFDIFREETKDELADLVKDNILAQYFASDKEEFENGLLIENPDFFPLPETTPYFTADGVVFVYQQYEIAPYALGLPNCVISYDLIEPFLTQAGKWLVNVGHVAEN